MARKSNLDLLTEELMQDPEFCKEYAKLEPEIQLKRDVMRAGTSAGMTQALDSTLKMEFVLNKKSE